MQKRGTNWYFLIITFFFIHTTLVNAVENQKLYVADGKYGPIKVLNYSLGTEKTIPIDTAIAYTLAAHEDKLYCIWSLSIYVMEITALKNTKAFLYDCQLAPGSGKAKILPDGSKMYIGGISSAKADPTGVFVIDLTTHTQTKILLADAIQSGFIDVSPSGKYLYCSTDKSITIINTSNDSTFKIIQLKGNEYAYDIAASEEGIIYVSLNSDAANQTSIALIPTLTSRKNIPKRLILKSGNIRLLYAPGKRLYALGDNALYVINAVNLNLINTYAYSGKDLALSRDGNRLFIASPATSEVIALDPNTGALISKRKVGDSPYALCLY